ncbi:MAG: SH3 domain-containing protein [Clostridia bacterium]|nr:SH3 domain-containing protein [Clostridia bacterium]
MNGKKLLSMALLLLLVLSFAAFASAENVKTTYEDGSLNVRLGPGTNYKVVGWVRNGQKITVLEDEGAWTKIIVDATGITGYIKSSYIEKEAPAPQVRPVYSLGSVKTKYASSLVNVRRGPGTKHEAEFALASGAKMRILGESANWYLIQAEDGKTGYISKNYAALGVKGETTANVNMRQGAGSSTPSLGIVPKGTKITLTGVTGNWTEVEYSGSTGFIYTKYVK